MTILIEEGIKFTVHPTWRPDRAMKIEAISWADYIDTLSEATATDTSSFEYFLEALKISHTYFDRNGWLASDHRLQEVVTKSVSRRAARCTYDCAYWGGTLSREDIGTFKPFLLGEWNRNTEWVTQLHIGAV